MSARRGAAGRALAAALMAISAAGCGAAAPAGAGGQSAGVSLTFAPDPPVARRAVSICAQPAAGGQLQSIRAWMPGMPPALTSALTPNGSGAYCGDLVFVMGGRWNIALQGTGPAGGTLTVEVRE